jgi:hypothetical protein
MSDLQTDQSLFEERHVRLEERRHYRSEIYRLDVRLVDSEIAINKLQELTQMLKSTNENQDRLIQSQRQAIQHLEARVGNLEKRVDSQNEIIRNQGEIIEDMRASRQKSH